MMTFRSLLAVAALLCMASPAFADSTAQPVTPGFLSTDSGVCAPNPATCFVPYSSTHPVPVTPSTPTGTQDTNLKQVNGATVNVGAGASSTGTQRVTTSTDSTIGTVTAVTAITNALPAGTAILGKVGIDQTTPGTTNGVNNLASFRATYESIATGYAGYATPTDMACFWGSGTKTVQVLALQILFQSTVAALQTIDFVKRSAANSGGTPTVLAATPWDSTDAAATGGVTTYASAPSTGAGTVIDEVLASTSTLTTAPGSASPYTFPASPPTAVTLQKPITLHGTSEGLCINYKGAALTSGFLASIKALWIEF